MKPSIHFLLLPSGTASGSSYGPPEICCLLSQLCKGSEGPDSGTVRGLLASGGPRPGQPTGLPLWGFPVDSLAPLSLHDANTEKRTSEHPGGQTFVQGETEASGEMLSTFPLSGEALREVCTTWGSRSTDQASQNTRTCIASPSLSHSPWDSYFLGFSFLIKEEHVSPLPGTLPGGGSSLGHNITPQSFMAGD